MAKYQPKRAPWEHQIQALDFLKGRQSAALLAAMRTGKTKMILDDFGRLELAGECQDILVVAPAGVYRTWETAAQEHLSEDLRRRLLVHLWQASGGKLHDRALEWFMA